MKNAKRLLLVLGSVLLLLVVGTAGALPPRITWNPNPLVTEEIAPGEEVSYAVTLKNTGLIPILAASQLRIVAEGAIVPYVTIEQPKFPSTFKRGQAVTFNVKVSVPDKTSAGEVTGSLVLKRVIRSKVVDVWRAEALPVRIQVVEPGLAPPSDPQVVEIGTGPDAISVNTQVYEGQIDLPPGVGPAQRCPAPVTGTPSIVAVARAGRAQERLGGESSV